MDYAIIDSKGTLENFNTLQEALDSIDRVREENDDIVGDLKVIQIHHIDN